MGHYDDLFDAEREERARKSEGNARKRIVYEYNLRQEQLRLISDFREKLWSCDASNLISLRHLEALEDLHNEVSVKLIKVEEDARPYLLDIIKDPK